MPGGLNPAATRLAFSAIVLNSGSDQARTVSTFAKCPPATAAMFAATASEPSGASATTTMSFVPVVTYAGNQLASGPFDQTFNSLGAIRRLANQSLYASMRIGRICDERRYSRPPCSAMFHVPPRHGIAASGQWSVSYVPRRGQRISTCPPSNRTDRPRTPAKSNLRVAIGCGTWVVRPQQITAASALRER